MLIRSNKSLACLKYVSVKQAGSSYTKNILGNSSLSRNLPLEPSCTVGGNVNWYSHYGEQYGGSLKN